MRQQTLLRGLMHLAAILSLPLVSAWAVATPSTCHVDLWPSKESPAEQLQNTQKIAHLQEEMQRLIAELRSEIAQITNPRERARREAELKQIMSRIETPLGLPMCRVESQASRDYVQEIVLRIEDCGTSNFPKIGGQSLYGAVTIAFITDAKGQLISSSVAERNDDARINLHALRIVRASTPFGTVPLEMRDGGYERFHYFTRFNFAHTDDEGSGSLEPKARCALDVPSSITNKATQLSPPSSPSTPANP